MACNASVFPLPPCLVWQLTSLAPGVHCSIFVMLVSFTCAGLRFFTFLGSYSEECIVCALNIDVFIALISKYSQLLTKEMLGCIDGSKPGEFFMFCPSVFVQLNYERSCDPLNITYQLQGV
ncbi:hypothetical protein RJT34_24787 [Clitoria ternatea]|uniref:Uncharacterized protein n=1 Tax=Clitoria ternatea TaxID=43366 RepID=A0AAN9IJH5_CLITE